MTIFYTYHELTRIGDIGSWCTIGDYAIKGALHYSCKNHISNHHSSRSRRRIVKADCAWAVTCISLAKLKTHFRGLACPNIGRSTWCFRNIDIIMGYLYTRIITT